VVVAIKDGAPKIGVAAAAEKAEKANAEAVKHTNGMAPLPRLAVVGSTAVLKNGYPDRIRNGEGSYRQ